MEQTGRMKNSFDKENFEWWELEGKTHGEILEKFRSECERRPWCQYFLDDHPLYPGNLNSKCRIGYVPFNNCLQDRFYYIDKSRSPEMIAAGGFVTQIFWDYDLHNLPDGWQGVVRQSFNDTMAGKTPNTLVALLVFTPNRYRGKGLARLVLTKMCTHAKSKGYRYLLVPALPPSQFERDKVELSMEEISKIKRSDGSYYDFWLRLHSQKGAEIIGFCETSHRFVLNLKDYNQYVSSTRIESTGDHIVNFDNDKMLGINSRNMWEKIYADIKRDFVTFNWGCVWMRYAIDELDL